jgi:hypothetical protein
MKIKIRKRSVGKSSNQAGRAIRESERGLQDDPVALTSHDHPQPLEHDLPIATIDVDLDALVARITPENRHPEVDWGEPRGKEIW